MARDGVLCARILTTCRLVAGTVGIVAAAIVARIARSAVAAPRSGELPPSRNEWDLWATDHEVVIGGQLPEAPQCVGRMGDAENLGLSTSPIRVLVAKPGLDGHDRGVKVIARALRDAGMEVIYTGLRQTPEMIVNAALQEDVEFIGLSILSGAHMAIVPKVIDLLEAADAKDIQVIVGGIIPDADIPVLEAKGVAQVFQTGTSLESIVKYLQAHRPDRQSG